MQSLTNDIKARHPGVVIGGIGDDAHKLRKSDHNEDDTAGSRAAQSDSDSVPEHRAIDVMLGSAINETQLQAIIDEILGDPKDLARLVYINFKNWQWAKSNGWKRADNSDDPHPKHGHFSGLAATDGDASPWLINQGGSDMIPIAFGEGEKPAPRSSRVAAMQRALIRAGADLSAVGGPDGRYGNGTANALIQVLGPDIAGDGRLYDDLQYDELQAKAYGSGKGEKGAPGEPGKTPTEVTFGPTVAKVTAFA